MTPRFTMDPAPPLPPMPEGPATYRLTLWFLLRLAPIAAPFLWAWLTR